MYHEIDNLNIEDLNNPVIIDTLYQCRYTHDMIYSSLIYPSYEEARAAAKKYLNIRVYKKKSRKPHKKLQNYIKECDYCIYAFNFELLDIKTKTTLSTPKLLTEIPKFWRY